jgi:hypothetical protein
LQDATLDGTICGDLSGNTRDIEVQQLLPLNFLDFTVDRVKAGARLQWSIADAINVSHFEVERFDEEQNAFVYIDEQPYLEGKTDYEDLDPNIRGGQRYLYRIRSVDFDGFTQVSPIRSIQTPQADAFVLYPNPARDYFRVQGPVEDIQQLRVYDMYGRKVLHEQGIRDNRISTADWPAGLYRVEITSPDGIRRLPLIIQ